MDPQIKKGILDICVLKCLSTNDLYGYGIIKEISPYIKISESTLYPILRRLELSDCLTTYTEVHDGRLRKYYKITDDGKQKLKQFIKDWPELDKIYKYILGGKSWKRKNS